MEQLLGPLEQRVMEALWKVGRGTVRDVLEKLPRSQRPAYTTLMTIMVRLHEKGLLRRTPKGNAFVYEPTLSEEDFIAEKSRKAVRDVLQRFGDLAFAHFLEESGLSPEQVQHLKKLSEDGEAQ